MPDSAQQCVLFPDIFSKPIVIESAEQPMSSDGGAILLIPIDRSMKLTESLAAAIDDPRQVGKVEHERVELIRQRVFAIAHGYPDANDAATLARDPALRLACERSPSGGDALASQPTLSRFENIARPRTLLAMAEALARVVLAQQQQLRRAHPPRLIRIDIDPTCDPTYGQQEFSAFNGFYGTSCYLPLLVTVSFDAESTKYLVAAVLRPGNASAMTGTLGVLFRLVGLLREYFPGARLRVRADSAFAHPQLLDCLEAAGMEYVIGMPTNRVLVGISQRLMRKARRRCRRLGRKITLYGAARYRAGSWSRQRRVVYKAEVVVHVERKPRDNDRYVVTNVQGKPIDGFEEFHGHHDLENRIKEMKLDLRMDKTGCESFAANQFRVLLSLAAAMLMQGLQAKLPSSGEFAGAQMGTIRERLFKRAVRVVESVRRIVWQFSDQYPWGHAWNEIASAVGAVDG
jgi:DDE family transposase